jgi:acetyl esterase/lipase
MLRKSRPGKRNSYALASDLSYGEFGVWNLLDIWARRDLPLDRRAPVLLQVHRGSWTMGSKRGQAHPLMTHLAERGWVCVAINYRLSPASNWPAAVVDVKRAIAWVKETSLGMEATLGSSRSQADQPGGI